MMSKGQCKGRLNGIENNSEKRILYTIQGANAKYKHRSFTVSVHSFLHTASMLVQGHAPPNGDRSARGAHRTNVGGGSGFARGGLHF